MPSQPNVLFILCDDLGINDLHCYGREDHNTPNLDKLARQGTRFTSFYASQAICSPSRAGLLTGLNPPRLHLTTYIPGRPDTPSQRVLHPEMAMQIPLEVKCMPRYFKEQGYTTGFIGKWHVGKSPGPADHGFDHVYHPGDGRDTTPSETEGGKAEYELTHETIRFIENNQDKPFLAYLGHYTPHINYTAQEHLVEKNADAFEPVYAALIETLDTTVGLIMDKLDELGLAENTIVVFTSDNGGLHVPEGNHDRVTHNTPYRAGKGYTYEGGSRVPTLIRWPRQIPASRVVDAPLTNIDWLPTLLELTGADSPEQIDGVSFSNALRGGDFPQRPLFWHFPHYTNQGGRPSGSMRDGDWLLIERYDEDVVELYNLANDISERTNVADSFPEKVSVMNSSLQSWREENNVQYNDPNPDCDEALFNQLYADTDPSQFDPLNATDPEWGNIQDWSRKMKSIMQPDLK